MRTFIDSAARARNVLIVDDEIINRELLGLILQQHYSITFASNGREALDLLRSSDESFSLILLDLMMPVMNGFEFMEAIKSEEELRKIPIIVMTSEKDAEVRSIRLGAADFITKPYDMPEVIIARCERIIELFEDKSIISSTEKDSVTGLYSKEFFFEYLRMVVSNYSGGIDAVVLNVERFHLVNELAGRKMGNRVLAAIGETIGETLLNSPGIACRAETDTFYICCAHREDYSDVLDGIQKGVSSLDITLRIRLRMGVYPNVSANQVFETWFDRAKQACDRVRGDFTRQIEFYSDKLHERDLYHERLINDLQDSIDNKHFVVYYQPKYLIQGSEPRLSSAEALVRWQHPELGFISPGDFIPLFESNGLIQKLDNYVWNEAAAQMQRWRDEYGLAVPVSVNVSRIDIYDPDLEKKLEGILELYGLTTDELMLEITESAYSDNADRLVEAVEHMRGRGFKIEMDDFGSGYSSLNMLTAIPIDVLKLDMKFIRNMLLDAKALKLVELILNIASSIEVPVVAEGVESEEQLRVLKSMGCDCIQGYYFSRPVPPEEFAPFIEEESKKRAAER